MTDSSVQIVSGLLLLSILVTVVVAVVDLFVVRYFF